LGTDQGSKVDAGVEEDAMNEDLDMRAGSVGVIPSTMKVDRKLISKFSL